MNVLTDQLNRPLKDLRISVIDRCNFRCPYCMPQEQYHQHYEFLKNEDWLRFDEIIRLTKIFTTLGVHKVRLTGGEPLLRPQLPELIQKLAQIQNIDDLALTTNGSLLETYAKELKTAGLQRLTISLDALNETDFLAMSGQKGSAQQVLRAIEKAQEIGFADIKINIVIKRGINDQHFMDIVKYFRGTGIIVRFIEYMDVGTCNHWEQSQVVANKEIHTAIHQQFPLQALESNYFGEVAKRYAFSDGKGEIGFISSVSQPFCSDCTRLRLSTDGKMYTCLFASEGVDLRTPLREGAADEELLQIIKNCWQKRSDQYSENRGLYRSLKSPKPKIEMYKIGG